MVPTYERWKILRRLGMDVDWAEINPGYTFNGTNIHIEHGCSLGRQVFLDGAASIHIGKGSGIGPQAMVLTTSHAIGPAVNRAGPTLRQPVRIGQGCWIGARSILLGGVTIGDGCIIAAGSVVIADCAPNGLYAGVPAVRKRDLDQDQVTLEPS
jgi:maltose O-acetyltransferase